MLTFFLGAIVGILMFLSARMLYIVLRPSMERLNAQWLDTFKQCEPYWKAGQPVPKGLMKRHLRNHRRLVSREAGIPFVSTPAGNYSDNLAQSQQEQSDTFTVSAKGLKML